MTESGTFPLSLKSVLLLPPSLSLSLSQTLSLEMFFFVSHMVKVMTGNVVVIGYIYTTQIHLFSFFPLADVYLLQ